MFNHCLRIFYENGYLVHNMFIDVHYDYYYYIYIMLVNLLTFYIYALFAFISCLEKRFFFFPPFITMVVLIANIFSILAKFTRALSLVFICKLYAFIDNYIRVLNKRRTKTINNTLYLTKII